MENRLDSSNYNLPLRPVAMPAQGEKLANIMRSQACRPALREGSGQFEFEFWNHSD
jgi:hypothetical protein